MTILCETYQRSDTYAIWVVLIIVHVFVQAVVATLRDADESATTVISDLSLSRDVARLSEVADLAEGPEDDDNGKGQRILLWNLV